MVKIKTKKSSKSSRVVFKQDDNIYFLKLVLYLILGSIWIRITSGSITIPIPVGLIAGLFFARTEKFAIDRKIEYAILLIATFVSFWLPIGLELVL